MQITTIQGEVWLRKALRRGGEWLSEKDQERFHEDEAFELPGRVDRGKAVQPQKALWDSRKRGEICQVGRRDKTQGAT